MVSVWLGFPRATRDTVAAGREGGGESGSTSESTTTGGSDLATGGTVDVGSTDESDLEVVGTAALGSTEKSGLDALTVSTLGGYAYILFLDEASCISLVFSGGRRTPILWCGTHGGHIGDCMAQYLCMDTWF